MTMATNLLAAILSYPATLLEASTPSYPSTLPAGVGALGVLGSVRGIGQRGLSGALAWKPFGPPVHEVNSPLHHSAQLSHSCSAKLVCTQAAK